MNLFEVIRVAPPEYSLILIVSSHEIKLAFFGTVPLRIHYSAHGGKNVIEETGERCNENSSWRGCTPLHTPSRRQLLALQVDMQTIYRYTADIDTPVPRATCPTV